MVTLSEAFFLPLLSTFLLRPDIIPAQNSSVIKTSSFAR